MKLLSLLLILLVLMPFKVEGQSSKQQKIDSLLDEIKQSNEAGFEAVKKANQIISSALLRNDTTQQQENTFAVVDTSFYYAKGSLRPLKPNVKYRVIWHEVVALVSCKWVYGEYIDNVYGSGSNWHIRTERDSTRACDTVAFRPTIIEYREINDKI